MTTRRRLLSTVLVMACLLIGPAKATPQRREAPFRFVSGGRGASIDVRVSETTPLDELAPSIDGRGRLIGFVLYRRDADEFRGLYAFVSNRCATPSCDPAGRPFGTVNPLGIDDALPKGPYRLLLIADGAPVTLRLGGAISPVGDAAKLKSSDVQYFSLDGNDAAGKEILSGGRFTSLEGEGLAAFTLWADGSGPVAFDDCHYNEGSSTRPPPELAFVPGCPTGGAQPKTDSEGPRMTYLSTWDYLPEGIGGWALSGVPTSALGGAGLFLRLPGF